MSEQLFYLLVENAQAGPYTLGQLQSMWRSGQVTAKASVWCEGKPDWESILTMAAVLDSGSRPMMPPPVPLASASRNIGRNRYVCPQCDSESIQSARNMYEGGTSSSISVSHAIGVVGTSGTGYGLAGGEAITEKKEQTLLAQRYAPPRLPKRRNGSSALFAIGCLVAIIVPAQMMATESGELGRSVQLMCAAGGVVFGLILVLCALPGMARERKEHEVNLKIYEAEKARWEESYLCHRCGYFGKLLDA